jgi:hypothetical protein
MLHKSSSKIELVSSIGAVSSQAMNMYINASPASHLTYSAEDMSGYIKSIFKGLRETFPKNLFKGSDKSTDLKAMDAVFKKIESKSLAKVGNTPIVIQDGLQVDLKTWIATLDECYTNISKELQDALQGLLRLFGELINNPDKIKSLSEYGSVEHSQVQKTNLLFQDMFGSSNRANKATLFDMVKTVEDLAEARAGYERLVQTKKQLDTKQVGKDIDRINELADEFITKYALRLSANRRAVADLSMHVHAIAEAVTLLSLLDYSSSVLYNTIMDIQKKI